jgi:FkbM family methyltransferase
MKSLFNLFRNSYNKKHKIFAISRFIEWKIIRILRIRNYTKQFWGRWFVINYDSFQCMWLYYNYLVDFEEFSLIRDRSKADSVMFDVGANMGFYGLWMSKYTGKDGSIHCFEPSTVTFDRLQKNWELNRNSISADYRLNNLAIGDFVGDSTISMGKDGENHLIIGENNATDSQFITMNTIDNYCKSNNISNIDYLKIDIEGFELFALKGAEDMLKNKRIEIIQIEINDTLENSSTGINELLDFINSVGYRLAKYEVDKKELTYIDYSESRENYFLIK